MTKEYVVAGLRNAIMRGERLGDAANSFLNAGYDKNEVQEAINIVSGKKTGVAGIVQRPQQFITQQVQKLPERIKSSKKKKMILAGIIVTGIVLAGLFILLIALLAS